jgi:hypothetical protein
MGLWKIGNENGLRRLTKARLENEALLETWIADQPDLLGQDLLIIGRQVRTDHGGIIDLLAIDWDGRVHILELKREKTPRDVVAQALDYASWVVTLGSEKLDVICNGYLKIDLGTAFRARFGIALPETLNEEHIMTIVASSLDPSSERIVEYLSKEHNLNINVVSFSIFGDGEGRMLGRSWLIDPSKVEQRAEAMSERRVVGDWTGYYFVNVGESESEGRSWEDCVLYGFVSGGQGERYRRAMLNLQPNDKIFAYVGHKGYVGYGIVTESAVMARDFETKKGSLLKQPLRGIKALIENVDDEINAEYVVAVEWKKTFDRDHAQTFPGIFANQNIVCKLRDTRTLEFLMERFGVVSDSVVVT